MDSIVSSTYTSMPSASSPYYLASEDVPQSATYSEVQLLPRSPGTFLKQSRHRGIASITLIGQDGQLPAYGSRGIVDGTINFTKTEDIASVEIKVRIAWIPEQSHTER
jgi:hypothetical protein